MSSTTAEREKMFDFIALIQDRPALWQKEHRDFLNRDIRTKLFQELAEMCGLSEEMCRKKLKNLKDKMRDISNKLPRTKSGQPAFEKGESIVRWPYYHSMLFMKEQFMGRETHGTIQTSTQEDSQQSSSACSLDSCEDEMSTESLPQPEIHALLEQRQTRSKSRMTKRSRLADEFLSMEREKMANLKRAVTAEETRESHDEWSAFCTSVMYDLQKLKDPHLKMRVKSDINKIVNDAVLQQLQQDSQLPTTTSTQQYQTSYKSRQ